MASNPKKNPSKKKYNWKQTLSKCKSMTMKRQNHAFQEQLMKAAEVKDWMECVLHGAPTDPDFVMKAIEFEDFFESMQTGVVLCQLVQKVFENTPGFENEKVKCNINAQVETFKARENMEMFCKAAEKYGLTPITLFESEDLVGRKNDKQVLNSLLELSRLAGKKKATIYLPQIVQMEMEIDEEDPLSVAYDPFAETTHEVKGADLESNATNSIVVYDQLDNIKNEMFNKVYDTEFEEIEVCLPQQYGLSDAEMDIIRYVFDKIVEQDHQEQLLLCAPPTVLDEMCPAGAPKKKIADALSLDDQFRQTVLPQHEKHFSLIFDHFDWATDLETPCDLNEFLQPLLEDVVVPYKYESDFSDAAWLPYCPNPSDPIDMKVAEVVNSYWIDIPIRKIMVRRKNRDKQKKMNHKHVNKELYRVGGTRVYVRLIRGELVVRRHGNWEDFITFATDTMENKLRQMDRMTIMY